MSVYRSTCTLEGFFDRKEYRNYAKYESDPRALEVWEWLRARVDWLVSSVVDHGRPALQGVVVHLEEELLCGKYGWTRENRDRFFITMIGAMVKVLLEEHGFRVKRSGVPLKFTRLITTAAKYELAPEVPVRRHVEPAEYAGQH